MTNASFETSVTVRAPGKINVYLGVGGRHANGYHSVATALQAVSLFEQVTAHFAEDFSVSIDAAGETSGVPLDDTNLALRAAKLLAEVTKYPGGVHLEIRKEVPVAGGMGGGSADAAAALVACDALWDTRLSAHELDTLAARLGADVPFALHGGTAIGTGYGERLNPALARGRFEWVLVTTTWGLSTPAVYTALDERREALGAFADDPPPSLDVPIALLQALRSGDPSSLAAAMQNDLEEASLDLRPELEGIIAQGLSVGALSGLVSGSGPTIAFLCEDANSADYVAGELGVRGHTALRVHGPVPGARIV